MIKKILLLSIAINLVLVIVIGAFYRQNNLDKFRLNNSHKQQLSILEKQGYSFRSELNQIYKNNPEFEVKQPRLYCSQTTDTIPEWKTYTSIASGISIRYPGYITSNKTGEKKVCDSIAESEVTASDGLKERMIGLAGHTLIYVVPWEKSLNEYVKIQDPEGIVRLERMSNKSNLETYKITHNWDLRKDPNSAPFYMRSQIIKGPKSLVIIGSGYGSNTMGCQWTDEYLPDERLNSWNKADSISFN